MLGIIQIYQVETLYTLRNIFVSLLIQYKNHYQNQEINNTVDHSDQIQYITFQNYKRMKKISFALIGGGPSSFYTAKLLIKLPCNPIIHILEKQLCPFGLIRYGVAPDHISVKKTEIGLSEVMKNPNVKFFGNVNVSGNNLQQIKDAYSGLIYAYGASSDIPFSFVNHSQSPCNVKVARDIVYWYNNHPDFENIPILKDKTLGEVQNVVIIGNGNVAIDIARIFLRNVEQLKKTEIARFALQNLKNSKIKNIQIVGRRGVTHAAYSLKQIRELYKLGIKLYAIKQQLQDSLNQASYYQYTALGDHLSSIVRMNKRKINFMKDSFTLISESELEKVLEQNSPKIIFRYLLSPIQINKQSTELECSRNTLVGQSFKQIAKPTQQRQKLNYDILISSMGFKVQQISQSLKTQIKTDLKIDGGVIPSQSNKNSLHNSNGCIIRNNKISIGQYAVGWCKNGAKGVIDETYLGCQQTFNNIRIHYSNHLLKQKSVTNLQELQKNLYKNSYSFDQYETVREKQFQGGNKEKWIRKKLSSEQIKSIYGL